MKQVTAAWIVSIVSLAWPGAPAAHHSLALFDTTTTVWVKGTVVSFDLVNPHARFVLDQPAGDGQVQRWVVDGPPSNNLARMRIGRDFLKPGDVIGVCGVVLKADAAARPQPPAGAAASTPAGRHLSGHLLVMPDGQRRFWSDYGVLERCLAPGEDAATLRREAFGR